MYNFSLCTINRVNAIVNQYVLSLQTEAEYAEKYLTYQKTDYRTQKVGNKVAKVTIFTAPENVKWPEQVDWRTRDAVSPIKDQV